MDKLQVLTFLFLAYCCRVSMSHECNRACVGGPAKLCEYKFDVQWYMTMSKACYDCPFTKADCYREECAPGDGQRRMIAAVNRQLPGPSIELCEGDTLQVEVTNSMLIAETPITIHWHGQHQRGTNYMDGVPNLTQCPIKPGETFTYKFQPQPAGTFMYHSHVGAQLGDGFFGSLIVRQTQADDPNSHLYDHDCDTPSGECEFTVIVNDWLKGTTSLDDFVISRYSAHAYYIEKTSLINGHADTTATNNLDRVTEFATTPLEVFNVIENKSYRFRLINLAAVSCRYEIAVDNHKLTVIAADGYPVQPREADVVTLFNGERYDVVIEANQTPGNFWFKALPIGECNVGNANANGVAIMRYNGIDGTPPYPRDNFIPDLPYPDTVNKVFPAKNDSWRLGMEGAIRASELQSFTDMPKDLQDDVDYILYIAMDQLWNDPWYDNPEFYSYELRTKYVQSTASFNNISFKFPHSPLLLNPDDMEHEDICNEVSLKTSGKDCYSERCRCTQVISIPEGAKVEIFLINESVNGKGSKGHPIHIHGYHGYLVGLDKVGGTSVTKSKIQEMNEAGDIPKNLLNPSRRDTVQVTGGGYAVIRFKADNPGLWFFHCHVQSHMLEGQSFILQVGDVSEFDPIPKGFPTCPNPKSQKDTDCPTTGATAENGSLFYFYYFLTSCFTALIMQYVFRR